MHSNIFRPRKLCALIVICVLISTIAGGLVGCSNDKQLIQDKIDSTLGVFKDPTLESIYSYMQDNGASDEDLESTKESFESFEDYGIDPNEYLSYFLRDFDYTIDDISIDGNTATADLTLTTKDFDSIAGEFQDYISSSEGIADMYAAYSDAGFDEKAMYKVAWEKLYDIIDDAGTTDTNLTLSLTKTSDGWVIDDDSFSNLKNALFSSMSKIGTTL